MSVLQLVALVLMMCFTADRPLAGRLTIIASDSVGAMDAGV